MARDKMFTIRVDEAEHALFKGAAAAVPVSISEYARDAMLARMALEEVPAPVEPRVVASESFRMITSTGDVPAAVERVAPARSFAPDPKVAKAAKRVKAEPAPMCRHGLLRCKVCGTG